MAHRDDVIWPTAIAYGGSLMTSAVTQKVYFLNGKRKVNVLSDKHLRVLNVSFPPGSYQDRYEVLKIFNAVGGDADTFLARDPADFNTSDGYMGLNSNKSNYWLSNLTYLDQPMQNTTDDSFIGDGGTTTFQLVKRYIVGASAIHTRAITKPYQEFTDSVLYWPKFALDGVEQFDSADLSLDYTTGIVTFGSAPGSGQVPTWGGPFYIPVEIANPDIMYKFTTGDLEEVLTVELREVVL